jgi:hypothetical protein
LDASEENGKPIDLSDGASVQDARILNAASTIHAYNDKKGYNVEKLATQAHGLHQACKAKIQSQIAESNMERLGHDSLEAMASVLHEANQTRKVLRKLEAWASAYAEYKAFRKEVQRIEEQERAHKAQSAAA